MCVSEYIDAETKTIIVLESLAGRPTSDLCVEYGIETKQVRDWRKVFLLNAPKIFESAGQIGSGSRRQLEIDLFKIYLGGIVSEKYLELVPRRSERLALRRNKLAKNEAANV